MRHNTIDFNRALDKVPFANSVPQHFAFKVLGVKDPDLLSWDEAMASPELDKWIKAAQVKIDALAAHKTLVEVPKLDFNNKQIIPGTWAFRVKLNPGGSF